VYSVKYVHWQISQIPNSDLAAERWLSVWAMIIAHEQQQQALVAKTQHPT
jgi:hypothetical protein